VTNKYPAWWSSTITIYNKYKHPETGEISWYRHKISDCFWKYIGNKINIGETSIETDNVICRIPANPYYKSISEWTELPSYIRARYFTLAVGDIVVLGNIKDTIDEYTEGQRSSDLLNKYKRMGECFVIERCTINNTAGLQHYYVRGV
jgi:hypothetical protein